MKKRNSVIALILAMLMLLGAFTACNGGGTETDAETARTEETTAGDTEATSDTKTESDTEADSAEETTAPVDDRNEGLNTSPLTLTPSVDLFPDVAEYEAIVSRENNKPTTTEKFVATVEAESYSSTTIPGLGKLAGKEYSGGNMIKIITSSRPAEGWDYVYSITYKVTVPRKGYYNVQALTTTVNQAFTSDYSISINGVRQIIAADDAEIYEDINYSVDRDLMFLYDFGILERAAGENEFTFTIDNEDSEKSKDRISFIMDYFTVSESDGNIDIPPAITIGADISALEDSELLLGAAEVNVFDERTPIKLSFAYYFSEGGEGTYAIIDYFGNTVYEGSFEGEAYDLVKIERLIKDHPTGYFTFTCGRQTMSYVVTPAYDTRTLEDSPFGMDLAAFYHIKTLANTYSVTAAARLAGVTWVRDRARWSDYEATPGVYDFTSTEKLFNTIKSTGMNLLVNLCGAPKWATESLGYTGTWTVAGFRDSQIAIFNMCREMAAYYDGVVDAWELWNESDHASSFELAEHFSAWYKSGALGILDSDPDVTVMIGGYCQSNQNSDYDHLSMINDILKYTNVFNYHSHIVQPKEYEYTEFSEIFMSDMAHASLSLYNGETGRPTWITEAGMRIDYMIESSYKKQANYLITSAVESFSIGTEKHFWFVAAPYMEGGGDFGTFSSDLEPYPALAAEAIMTKVLGKADYVGTPRGLSKNAYGYTFSSGERIVEVLWSIRNGDKYVIETSLPVIVTDMMGNETLYQPEGGKITVRLGINPVYVTYSTAPDYLPHNIANDEMSELTFTAGERVILSPEFENYNINDKSSRTYGHLIESGTKINLRVTNLNDFEVKGSVSATLEGFEVIGGDEEITITPYSEVFVTLTLKKTDRSDINGYIVFTGVFNGEETSHAASHVRTEGAEDAGVLTIDEIFDGQTLSLEKDLTRIKATLTGAVGTPKVLINDKEFDNYTYENGVFTLNIFGFEDGNYTLIVAVETSGGDYIFTNLLINVEDGKYQFLFP